MRLNPTLLLISLERETAHDSYFSSRRRNKSQGAKSGRIRAAPAENSILELDKVKNTEFLSSSTQRLLNSLRAPQKRRNGISRKPEVLDPSFEEGSNKAI